MASGATVEGRFGLSAPAFQLSPDPAFFFGSPAHARALAELRAGAQQGEGFIVVSGEAGLGKTLLVKALLSQLPAEVEAAHIVVTPAGRRQVLGQVLAAFGVPARGGAPAQQLAALEAFLLTLLIKGRRALLVVDEAQGLDREALEELRTLTNLQVGQHNLIQVFLIGQPQLAHLLNSRAMVQLRQRVQAFCRLQPLSAEECTHYIEHRLRHVGWHGEPAFHDAALAHIHRWSEGVPRRINALCNRLLLAACLEDTNHITPSLAERTAAELDAEQRRALPAAPPRPAPAWQLPQPLENPLQAPPLLCVAASRLDVLLARTLATQLRELPDAPNLLIVAQEGSAVAAGAAHELREPGSAWLELPLGLEATEFPRNMSEALRRMDALLEVIRPCGVFLLGDSDLALACALVARRRRMPLARAQAGLRGGAPSGHSALIERLTQLNLTPHVQALSHLRREGLAAEPEQVVGSLPLSLLQHAAERGWTLRDAWQHSGATASGADPARPYLLASLRVWPDDPWPVDSADVLRTLAEQVQVLWLVDEESQQSMAGSGFAEDMQRHGIHTLHSVDDLDILAMLSQAHGLLQDASLQLAALAESLGLPRLYFDPLDQARYLPTIAGTLVVTGADEAGQALNDILLQAESPARSAGVQAASQAAALLHAWVSLSHHPQS